MSEEGRACLGCHAGFLDDVASGRCAAAVTAARCDTGSAEEVAAVMGPLSRARGAPLVTSVLVSGGVLADAILAAQTAGGWGCRCLHAACRSLSGGRTMGARCMQLGRLIACNKGTAGLSHRHSIAGPSVPA